MRGDALLITGPDIRKVLDIGRAIAIVEKAFASHGRGMVVMPPKIYVKPSKHGGDFRAMPAYVGGIEACGVKWVSVHPSNRRKGLPTVMAIIILSDPSDGGPLAVMDGTYITNVRTGAAGAVAASWLARPGSASAAFLGCGVQARFQLDSLMKVLRIRKVSAYDTDHSAVTAFVRYARRLGVTASRASGIRELVQGRDIVVTTTPSTRPMIRADWISPGTHINAIGADAKGKEELDAALLIRAKVVVDDVCQAVHSGEINVPISKGIMRPASIYGTLGEIVTHRKAGRTSGAEVTVFDSTGLAIQDIAVAREVYLGMRRRKGVRRIRFL